MRHEFPLTLGLAEQCGTSNSTSSANSETLACTFPASHFTAGLTAISTGQRALLKGKAGACCISYVERCSVLAPP